MHKEIDRKVDGSPDTVKETSLHKEKKPKQDSRRVEQSSANKVPKVDKLREPSVSSDSNDGN